MLHLQLQLEVAKWNRRYASLAQRWIKLSDLNNHLVINLPPYHLPSIKFSHHSQLLSKHPTTPQSNLLLSCLLSFNQLFSIFPDSMPRTFFILQLQCCTVFFHSELLLKQKRRPFWSLESVYPRKQWKCRNFRVWSVSRQSKLLLFQSLYGGAVCSMHMTTWAVKEPNFGTRESRILGTQTSMK